MLHAWTSKQIWEDIQRRLAVFDGFLYLCFGHILEVKY